ncbi:hypothetical protein ASO20_02530 [Mycoplasma sp. (ex Biomphalaria glabrata)]|uniref:inorganic diphosphatase n=1 Tax=Mycoplasma sp. (ex Biomphalaria glabrata) TaxID=1749074 RepID=UPI00073AB2FE|nr:inorganic diphosphatase [Mycoplasma sp. (ex Biomphalaria glabrata)]ALV23511.1 hypothetical protein ASO20_02530 [Mycoplasma sp. (ex Biomphalaria glabrata)]
MKLNVIVEIAKGSNVKYEYDFVNKRFVVDRILYGSNFYPMNYGYIENTLDYDGDPLDVLIVSDQPFAIGCEVPVRILGAMEMIDNGDIDTKLIGVIDCDPRYKDVNKLEDIAKHRLDEIKNFFETYKILQKKEVKVGNFVNLSKAEEIIEETKNLYKKCEQYFLSGNKKEIDRIIKEESKGH